MTTPMIEIDSERARKTPFAGSARPAGRTRNNFEDGRIVEAEVRRRTEAPTRSRLPQQDESRS